MTIIFITKTVTKNEDIIWTHASMHLIPCKTQEKGKQTKSKHNAEKK
jgi:hypothetical protein